MMNRVLRAAALAAALSLPSFLSALEAREGLVKIVVDETSARFSLYRLVDVAKDRYVPMFFDQDPRTTNLTLAFEGKQYRLGDSADFRQSVSRVETGIVIEFRSAFARVSEKLEFSRSEGAAIADGIRFTIVVENVSQKDASVGLRFLLDTSLAEKSGVHFRTPSRDRMTQETVLEGGSYESWVSTPGDEFEFMVQFRGDGLTAPDRVHFANWKRLNESPWLLDASGARNFTLLPYSVNDSAIAMYWTPRKVVKGESFSVTTAFGAFNEKGYPALGTSDTGTENLFSKTVLAQGQGTDKASLIAADLLAVRDLLSRIDIVLSSGVAPSADEVAAWKKILDLLEERKKGY